MDWSSYSEGSVNGGDSDTAGIPSVMSTSSEDSGDMAIHGDGASIDRCLVACDMILLDLKQRYKEHRRTPEWQEIHRLEEVLEDLHFNLAAKSYAAQHVQRLNEVYVKGKELLQQPYPGEDTEAIIGKRTEMMAQAGPTMTLVSISMAVTSELSVMYRESPKAYSFHT